MPLPGPSLLLRDLTDAASGPEPLTLPLHFSHSTNSFRRRDSASVSLSDAFDITYNVLIDIGGISAPLVLDTGSADMWVLSDDCTATNCPKSTSNHPGPPLYPTTHFHRVTDIELLYGDSRTGTQASGALGSDSVGVAGFSVHNQYFAAINNTNTLVLETGSSGIFGLGFPVNSILWNELYTIAVLGDDSPSTAQYRTKRALPQANNRQLPTRPPLTGTGTDSDENNMEATNMGSTKKDRDASSTSGSAPSLGILASFATYGPLLTRLILKNTLTSPQFTITLDRISSDSVSSPGGGGTLTLGGLPIIDPNSDGGDGSGGRLTNASLVWAPVRLYTPEQNGVIVPEARGETYPYAWEVPLDAVWFDGVKLEASRLGAGASEDESGGASAGSGVAGAGAETNAGVGGKGERMRAGVGTTALVDTGNSLVRGPADVVEQILEILMRKERMSSSTKGPKSTSVSSLSSRTRPYMQPRPRPTRSSSGNTKSKSRGAYTPPPSPSHTPASASSSSPAAAASSSTSASAFIASYDPYDYLYPCAEAHELRFTIAGRDFVVDPRDLGRVVDMDVDGTRGASVRSGDHNSGGGEDGGDIEEVAGMWCVPALAPTDPPVLGGYLYSWSLGQPFLRGVLTSFYYGNITHPSVDPPRIGFYQLDRTRSTFDREQPLADPAPDPDSDPNMESETETEANANAQAFAPGHGHGHGHGHEQNLKSAGSAPVSVCTWTSRAAFAGSYGKGMDY